MRKILKRDAVPSIFAWTRPTKQSSVDRAARFSRRQHFTTTPHGQEEDVSEDCQLCDAICGKELSNDVNIVACEIVVNNEESSHTSDNAVACSDSSRVETLVNSAGTQTVDCPPFDIDNFISDPEGLHYYTGLENYSKLMYVLSTLGYAAYHLNYYKYQCEKLSVPNQFLLTLMKLRMHLPNFQLSRMFKISESSVSNIFITWINFMSKQWRELNIFPTREMTSHFMPDDFKRCFPSTRIIIDGMECQIKKPKNPVTQQATFSYYKNMNTVKSVIGSTPGGLISYVSPAYGGSTSDRHIIERSDLGQLCQPGDSIMADKGFSIQDLMAVHDVHVNIPTFLKKTNRFHPKVLNRDRKIASKRVHIERHIGLAKTFKILKQPMTPCETALASDIIFVCFALCNFRSCIIPCTA